ncbi:efflux transporter outer membrane subunit [Amaricoccus solimangrovi]|uniref:Efflux transporter outer membrane subunit n=1 Tax=Amaricoccus solimangrovi TaxID=2589815 RepID=A0A501WG82_9RHOB|nr:efflux transporter outer membrane subunit [Amaricoccus solimangrovi]TPE47495.1 efflux transporter outer membrane subunit [Amaricoccus solimangrovi]
MTSKLSLLKRPPAGLALVPVACLLAACAVGPDYHAPSISLSSRFAESGAASDGDVALERWWTGFGDPTLNALADQGLAQNLDILTAVERINQSEAVLRATGLPALVSGDIAAGTGRSKQQGSIATESSATAAADLVIDLFGGERRAQEQATAQLQASELDVGTARLAFLSSLVGAYVDARYYQEAAAITRGLIESRQQTRDLVKRQQSVGLATDLDVLQSQALLDQTRATLPAFEQGFASSVFAMATLLATPAAPLMTSLQRGAAQPRPPAGAGAGIPADLLRNRPDVRAAERSYAAAVANVGVAEASLYPSLDLAGAITASNPSSWSFGPALVIPVLNQPLLRASRDQAISEAKQAELGWRQTVLSAVEDVQTAQGATIRGRRELSAQRAATENYGRARDLSQQTYEAGTTTFLDFLDAERSAGTTALALALSRRSLAIDWVSLQIAAGRGWAAGP